MIQLHPDILTALYQRIDKLPKPYGILVRIRFDEILEKSKKREEYQGSIRDLSAIFGGEGGISRIAALTNSEFLNDLFTWSHTPEGGDFWCNVFNSFRDIAYERPQIPTASLQAIKDYIEKQKPRKVVPVQHPELSL